MEQENLNTSQNPPMQQKVVIRNASEVLSRFKEAEKELVYHQEWYNKT